jgi:MYXO-CTERM domain-containing protein
MSAMPSPEGDRRFPDGLRQVLLAQGLLSTRRTKKEFPVFTRTLLSHVGHRHRLRLFAVGLPFALLTVTAGPADACVGSEPACEGATDHQLCSKPDGVGTCQRTGCTEAPAYQCQPLDVCRENRAAYRTACAGLSAGDTCSLDAGAPDASAGTDAGGTWDGGITPGSCIPVRCGSTTLVCFQSEFAAAGDAGMPPPADAGSADAGSSSSTPDSGGSGGCNVTSSAASLSPLALIAAVALLVRRRRRTGAAAFQACTKAVGGKK